MSDDHSPDDAPFDDVVGERSPARALVDIDAGSQTDHAHLVGELADLIGERAFNVLGLGPPLRLSVDADAFVIVLDRVTFERVRIRFWPYSFDDTPDDIV